MKKKTKHIAIADVPIVQKDNDAFHLVSPDSIKGSEYPKEKWNSSTNQTIKGKFVDREVLCNVSLLVSYILQVAEEGKKGKEAPFTSDDVENFYETSEDENDDDVGDPKEVFEWWAVSKWFLEKLREKKEVVIDTYPPIWGRTTTGQAILLDSVISEICADMEILEGQANSWEK